MERSIEIYAAITLTLMGLSHIIRPKSWIDFFKTLHRWGRTGAFIHGLLSLFSGALIVGFHNVWHGIPIVLTILGWLYVLKSIVVFLFPDVEVKSLSRINSNSTVTLLGAGIFQLAMGIVAAYCVLIR